MSYTWAVVAGSLPPGLSLSAAGAITGTPSLAGTYNFTVQATDTLGAAGTRALSITITAGALAVATQALAPAALGAPYTAPLDATGGSPPYSWVITAGSLPPGLSLAANFGPLTDEGGTVLITGEDGNQLL